MRLFFCIKIWNIFKKIVYLCHHNYYNSKDMENNIFTLSVEQSKAIGLRLQEKIMEGLREDGKEIACFPTYINPGKDFEGKVLALDWGGTNFRASIVQLRLGS